MRQPRDSRAHALRKAPTGVTGFDGITRGGLPRGRTTLLGGGPGSGKTIFALQFLAHGARSCGEPGILVAFEETPKRITENAAEFGWGIPELQRKGKLWFLGAQPQPDQVQAGDFDLGGMLATLEMQVRKMGARRIVFDALDIVLSLLPDIASQRREIHRLHEWLLARQLTGIITLRADFDESNLEIQRLFWFMQFMVDCAIILNHGVELGVSQRSLRVQKYRGSGFDEDESPFVIGRRGLEIATAQAPGRREARGSSERVSSGIERLDSMLDGGYFRGASVLITGSSGTAKTTLSGAFAQAACARGERTMFVSFDSDCREVIRNLASVGIKLEPYVRSGLLLMVSARAISGSAETYLARIKSVATEHGARCLVIDPVSTWSITGNELTVNGVAERLIDWSKSDAVTVLCTKLLDDGAGPLEGTSPLQISRMADTWIHVNYMARAGERNRGLSIIKSRGSAHSNQVRELVISGAGVTLADAYTAAGEVLMGTLRWEKECAEQIEADQVRQAEELRRIAIEAEVSELEARLGVLRVDLLAKREEAAVLDAAARNRQQELKSRSTRIRELRGADVTGAVRK